jgi:hypothetical protein
MTLTNPLGTREDAFSHLVLRLCQARERPHGGEELAHWLEQGLCVSRKRHA